MLSLSEILSNRKEVVFSFGEDTITIVYKPYAMSKRDWKKFYKLARRVDMKQPESGIKKLLCEFIKYPEQKLFKKYLKKVILEWDFTENNKTLSVNEGLKVIPDFFIKTLYYKIMEEITESTKQTYSAELKKK